MLAKIQAKIVGKKLQSVYPELIIEYYTSTTIADRDIQMNISKSESTGLFTRDISRKIISGEFDIAVHSWKDLPVDLPKETKIIGTIKRGDIRDILIIKNNTALCSDRDTIEILSSSPRRKHNLKLYLSKLVPFNFNHLSFLDVRGNIETRLKKFKNGSSDGIVIAKVAIDRILESNDDKSKNLINKILQNNKWLILPLSVFPTAPGQGAIAIESRTDRSDLKEIISKINDRDVFYDVMEEKKILSKHGGGCQQKIGVSIYSKRGKKIFSMKGQTEEGDNINKYKFAKSLPDKNFRTVSEDLLYPLKSDKNLFNRNKISNSDKISKLENSFIYLSRKNVLDDVSSINSNNFIWTSGLKCWQYVSSLGYWVNGTSDSLGNINTQDIKNLLPDSISQYNLSHSKAISSDYELISTYELKIDEEVVKNLKIQDKKYFYWMSSAQFDIIYKHYPNIVNANHSCGFGKTYDYLKTKLPKPDKINCFLSYDHWLSYYKKKREIR